jgi:hypothetical protein
MPKRWKIVAGGSFKYQLLDRQGEVLYESRRSWPTAEDVDDELDKIMDGDIEFPDDPKEKRPKHHRNG